MASEAPSLEAIKNYSIPRKQCKLKHECFDFLFFCMLNLVPITRSVPSQEATKTSAY